MNRPPISPAQSSPGRGLTTQEAADRLSECGPNDPTRVKRGATITELLVLFLNPLVIILLIASFVSFVLGNGADAAIILVIVLLSISINFVQTYRSERTIEKLRQHVTSTAMVLRDGTWTEIKRDEIVPGDVIRLCAGDLVPADARLLDARDLYVQQGALTGESSPSEKHARSADHANASTPDSPDLVFLGTSVVSGSATAEVIKTGRRTVFGGIAERLATRPEETEFERSMKRLGLLITRAVFFLVLFILVVRVGLHKNAFESLVFAVALAVGLTPEFLPMISSVTLARGAIRMAHHQVVVKHLSAIQNFGAIDVLCSDKTGTLTTGEMVLSSAVDCSGTISDRPFELAYLNSKFETGIRSPLDTAILKTERRQSEEYSKCDEIPFDFNRRRLSIIVERSTGGAPVRMLITKGAPEGILELSESYEASGRILPLDSDMRKTCRATFEALSRQGFRVLAVAGRSVENHDGFTIADELALTFVGFLAFADPPNTDAASAVAAMKRDGIQMKILTGDNYD